MRIGFGTTILARSLQSGGIDGIGSYTREMLKHMMVNKDLSLVPFSFGYPRPPVEGMPTGYVQLERFAMLAMLSAVSGLPFASSRQLGKLDLLHATDHRIPNMGKLPVVATIMDAIPLSHPEWVNMRFASAKNALWKRTAHWADHIITISEHSKREIESHFGIPGEKISVTPLGVDERWFQSVDPELSHEILMRYDLPARYFLSVGTLQPRKNIGRVIEAYLSLPASVRSEVPLLIVGRPGWRCEELVQVLSSDKHGGSVRWLKYLSDRDLLVVMKNASALVFASLYEGFGLPVLEAFAAGVPVVTSNSTSLPEVAGDAALLVDPLDVADIAANMLRLLDDSVLADTLRQRGYARARARPWNRTSDMTVDIYRRCLGA